ncbi:MAG: BCD family MFS transporter [Blastochloris sp.]|nr:BCD family MFS transporter [Blastochloris sp.]
MADVIATGIWNRIMITDLGFSATPVGLLLALRYFLAPLGIWAGQQSDRRAIAGYRRLPWVWGGRGLMALSVALLGITTASIAATFNPTTGASADAFAWFALAFSLLLFSLGNALSSSTFLALIYDRSAPADRGRNIGIVWTYLLVGFTIGGVLFGLLLPHEEGALGFTPESLLNLFIIGALVIAGIWFFSLLGEEKRVPDNAGAAEAHENSEYRTNLLADFRTAWRSRPMRYFFWYLSLSMIFAFSQDPILEPFAGSVFEMSAAVTTRFTAYWGTTAIIATIAFLILGRRYKSLTNERMNLLGVGVLLVTFVLFAASSIFEIRQLVTPA